MYCPHKSSISRALITLRTWPGAVTSFQKSLRAKMGGLQATQKYFQLNLSYGGLLKVHLIFQAQSLPTRDVQCQPLKTQCTNWSQITQMVTNSPDVSPLGIVSVSGPSFSARKHCLMQPKKECRSESEHATAKCVK